VEGEGLSRPPTEGQERLADQLLSPAPAPEEGLGGSGGTSYILPGPGPALLKNARLERRALIDRWPIPAEERAVLVNRQVDIAKDPNSSAREACNSFKAVLSADVLNFAVEKLQRVDLLEKVLSQLEQIYGSTEDSTSRHNGHVNQGVQR